MMSNADLLPGSQYLQEELIWCSVYVCVVLEWCLWRVGYSKVMELESVFLNVRKTSMRASFTTFDRIPRVHALINATRFCTPKVRGVTVKDEAALNRWLSWLSEDNKLVANLEMPNARAPALPSVMQSVTTRKQKDRMMAKVLAVSTRLISTVTSNAIHFPSSKTLSSLSTSKPS